MSKPAGDVAIMTLQEAANFLRVHRSTIYRILKEEPGSIPGVFKIGSDWRFTLDGLREFMEHEAVKTANSNRL